LAGRFDSWLEDLGLGWKIWVLAGRLDSWLEDLILGWKIWLLAGRFGSWLEDFALGWKILFLAGRIDSGQKILLSPAIQGVGRLKRADELPGLIMTHNEHSTGVLAVFSV
jgi:hypothetical protein